MAASRESGEQFVAASLRSSGSQALNQRVDSKFKPQARQHSPALENELYRVTRETEVHHN
jgi:hypothetical protein